ncbi:MAG TPA: GIY-YIG nuclease family protein [Bacteroidales bacterium]|nr:GIY-YIG nuclease family protein [Bacteroidales bacterium]
MKGWMYILECSDGSYYVGSTINLEKRIEQHNAGEGANHTKKHLPVKLVYFEEFERIDFAFYREKQVQKWRREKKEALINNKNEDLPELSKNYGQYKTVPSTSSGTVNSGSSGNVNSGSSGNVNSSSSDTVNNESSNTNNK